MNVEITKVKVKGAKVHVEWSIEREQGDTDDYTLKCVDAPAPSFVQAWNKLQLVITEEAELPNHMAVEITPIGLSVTYYDDGRWGAVVSGTRQLKYSNAPLVINTPHKPAEPSEYNKGDDNILLEKSVAVIQEVLEEAEKYINGDRAQQGLFAEHADEEPVAVS